MSSDTLVDGSGFSIRLAQPDDVASLVALVNELALFERAPDEVELTEEQLQAALFAPTALVTADVAEVDGAVVAMAIWYVNYSTWTGYHGIFLEDLYVQPDFRRRGIGAALLSTLAKVAVERGYTRLDWRVLDWNEPARAFYHSIGAVGLEEWTTFRLAGESLHRAVTR